MKIVIDISEDTYNRIKIGEYTTNPELGFAIQDGIVLPKHIDLIDRSKLAYYRCPNNVKDCPSSYDFICNSCDFGIIHKFQVDRAEAVIPADKEKRMRIEFDEEQKSNSLCDTCKIGDTCDDSDKGKSWANTHKCFRYEWLEKENKE